ncbi:hypothetical protein [Alloscardovia criceti]|uniref:hypothetical protein n=1 Tax=Alloscardovia criceti TaxID=356828 RepID=UPI00038175A3|nr:hypothetical protein [Alloscardovia criceti]
MQPKETEYSADFSQQNGAQPLSEDADFSAVIEHYTQVLENLQSELDENNHKGDE